MAVSTSKSVTLPFVGKTITTSRDNFMRKTSKAYTDEIVDAVNTNAQMLQETYNALAELIARFPPAPVLWATYTMNNTNSGVNDVYCLTEQGSRDYDDTQAYSPEGCTNTWVIADPTHHPTLAGAVALIIEISPVTGGNNLDYTTEYGAEYGIICDGYYEFTLFDTDNKVITKVNDASNGYSKLFRVYNDSQGILHTETSTSVFVDNPDYRRNGEDYDYNAGEFIPKVETGQYFVQSPYPWGSFCDVGRHMEVFNNFAVPNIGGFRLRKYGGYGGASFKNETDTPVTFKIYAVFPTN